MLKQLEGEQQDGERGEAEDDVRAVGGGELEGEVVSPSVVVSENKEALPQQEEKKEEAQPQEHEETKEGKEKPTQQPLFVEEKEDGDKGADRGIGRGTERGTAESEREIELVQETLNEPATLALPHPSTFPPPSTFPLPPSSAVPPLSPAVSAPSILPISASSHLPASILPPSLLSTLASSVDSLPSHSVSNSFVNGASVNSVSTVADTTHSSSSGTTVGLSIVGLGGTASNGGVSRVSSTAGDMSVVGGIINVGNMSSSISNVMSSSIGGVGSVAGILGFASVGCEPFLPSDLSAIPSTFGNQPTIFPPLTTQSDELKRGIKRSAEESEDLQGAVKRRVAAAAGSDRQRVINPDYITAFASHEDAWQRLLSYHLFQDKAAVPPLTPEEKWRMQLERTAKGFVDRLDKVKENLSTCLRSFAEKPPKEELILLEKLCFYEEKVTFDNMKARAVSAAQQTQRAMTTPTLSTSSTMSGLSSMGNMGSSGSMSTASGGLPTFRTVNPLGAPTSSNPLSTAAHHASTTHQMNALSQLSQLQMRTNLTHPHTLSMKDIERNNPLQKQ